MAKFLFIYRESTESRAQPSPEEMQALQAAWYTWMQKFSSAIVPGGDGLKHTGRFVKAELVTDGPYVEAKEIIVSFTIIQADDYDAAVAIARACPPGHTIEIREFAGYA
ncbi:MAG TPA: YciI family protein [Gemmataceae bacterium]|nr:YciI family protein [Gemmataceae bacterium]